MATPSIGGRALKRLFSAGVESLSQNVERINRLNVYPVPDGDTGINMFHTLQRAYREIEHLDSDDASYIAERFAYGALLGARGNSGTILSQLLTGFAEGMSRASALNSDRFAIACREAVKLGYASVSVPTEGTILTVAREATEALHCSDAGTASLRYKFSTFIAAAQASLTNTPALLPILREAGVVDAGGMGLVCFLEGMLADPSDPQYTKTTAASNVPSPAVHAQSYGYDVQFLMIGKNFDIDQVRRDLEQLGWSVIVVGDSETMKVHIHVENPAIPLDYAIRSGAALEDVVVENMDLQARQIALAAHSPQDQADSEPAVLSVIAVAEGEGLLAIFRDLGCSTVIRGGAGRNPATEDFVAAIKRAPSEHVIVLPNDRNILLAAKQGAALANDKQVNVIATETVLHGISAMLAFADASDGGGDPESILTQMKTASAEMHSIEITRATRTTRIRDLEINQGDFIAIVDGMICSASPELERVTLDAIAQLEISRLELATIYYGDGASELESVQLIRRISNTIKELEFEAVYGGQSLYPFLISVE